MRLSGKQLVVGSAMLIVLSIGVAVLVIELTDDAPVARLTESAACNVWNAGASTAARVRAVQLMTHDAHVAVFLNDAVSPQDRRDREDIEAFIKTRPDVESVVYESKTDAHRRFVELFANEQEILEATSPETLPESFRVVLRSPEAFEPFRDSVANRRGVNQVRDDRRPQPHEIPFEGPLFTIKGQGFYVDAAGRRIPEPPGCAS